jgi:hypothetical protein
LSEGLSMIVSLPMKVSVVVVIIAILLPDERVAAVRWRGRRRDVR